MKIQVTLTYMSTKADRRWHWTVQISSESESPAGTTEYYRRNLAGSTSTYHDAFCEADEAARKHIPGGVMDGVVP